MQPIMFCLTFYYEFYKNGHEIMRSWAYGVVVSMFDFHRSNRGSNPFVKVKFHNVYDYTIERHPWQVSENHKTLVHPSHEGNWVVRLVPDETQD